MTSTESCFGEAGLPFGCTGAGDPAKPTGVYFKDHRTDANDV
jgi:hypothetical protein